MISSVIPMAYILLAYHSEHYQSVKKVDSGIIKGNVATIDINSTARYSYTTNDNEQTTTYVQLTNTTVAKPFHKAGEIIQGKWGT